jgi:hypothetical protein
MTASVSIQARLTHDNARAASAARRHRGLPTTGRPSADRQASQQMALRPIVMGLFADSAAFTGRAALQDC